jgi:hypothetical protein
MMSRKTVVPKVNAVTKAELHAKLMVGWNRCIGNFGKGAFADALEITGPGLDRQLTGSMPDFATICTALLLDRHVLDEVMDALELRIVDRGAVCSTDQRASTVLVAALKKSIEAEADGHIDHNELLGMEAELRATRALVDDLLQRISDIRKPRVAA